MLITETTAKFYGERCARCHKAPGHPKDLLAFGKGFTWKRHNPPGASYPVCAACCMADVPMQLAYQVAWDIYCGVPWDYRIVDADPVLTAKALKVTRVEGLCTCTGGWPTDMPLDNTTCAIAHNPHYWDRQPLGRHVP